MMFNVLDVIGARKITSAFPKLGKVREFTRPLSKLNKNKVILRPLLYSTMNQLGELVHPGTKADCSDGILESF